MSVHAKGGGWVVRWREADGVNRSKSFRKKGDASAFDKEQKQAIRRARENDAIRVALQDSWEFSADQLRNGAKIARAFANGDFDGNGQDDLIRIRIANRIADALEHRAERMDADEPVADNVPVERVEPTNVVDENGADGVATYAVTERVPEEIGGGERRIHDGYFLTIEEAEAYRREQSDTERLDVLLMHNRGARRAGSSEVAGAGSPQKQAPAEPDSTRPLGPRA